MLIMKMKTFIYVNDMRFFLSSTVHPTKGEIFNCYAASKYL